MKRFLLKLAYDGSNFSGWQIQPQVRTVQGVLENHLSEIGKTAIRVTGSSRTDAGVHSLEQYCHLDFPVKMTPRQLQLALHSKLPKDIKIDDVFIVPPDFHARYDACERSYRFEITKELTPFNRHYKTYFPRYDINFEAIKSSLHIFQGKNDFELFSQPNPKIVNHICDVREIDFLENDQGYTMTITANRFLHKMVRRIAGSLVKLSTGENLQFIVRELLNKNREYLHIVYTAPPQGLYLTKVGYPAGIISQQSR